MSGGTAGLLALVAVNHDAVEHAAVFGGAVVGVFPRDVDLAVGVDLAAFPRLTKRHVARFSVGGHGHQARTLKAILIGRCGAALHPGFGNGLGAVRPVDIAGERGSEVPKALGRKWLGLAQKRHGMAARLARTAETLA